MPRSLPFRAEAARHGEIHLYRAALPGTSDGVLDMELDFRAVERALARQFFPGKAGSAQGGAQSVFGFVPDFVGADPPIRPQRQLDHHVVKTELGVNLQHQRVESGHLLLYLAFSAEDVAVVLHETTHPHQAVQPARRFVAVA